MLAAVFARAQASEDPQVRRRARFLRTLGLAINAMLALEGSEVSIEYLDESGDGVVLEFARDGRATVQRGVDLGSLRPGRIRVRRAWPWQWFWMWNDECNLERALLCSHCLYSSAPVRIDDGDIAGGPRAALLNGRGEPVSRVVDVELKSGEVIGAAGQCSANARAEALILTRGVLSETVPMPKWSPGLRAVVDVDLRKDLAQSKVIRDEAFSAVMTAIERSFAQLS